MPPSASRAIGAADDVDDGEGAVAAAPGLAQGGQGVGGLAGLGDDQEHRVFFQRRVPVTKFVRELHFHRDSRQFLDQIFAHQRRVPACAARRNHDALKRAQLVGSQVQAAELGRRPFLVHPAAQRVFHRLGLLEYLLEHEMLVLPPHGVLLAELQPADLHVRRVRTQVHDCEPVGRDRGHVVVVQVNHLFRVGNDGIGVAGQEMLARADANDKRRTAPGADDGVRFVG